MNHHYKHKKNVCRCFISIFLILISAIANGQTDKFINSRNQLSNSHINNICQDKEGLIWICTDNGLNVFNGTSISTFFHSEKDSTSINSNSVLYVMEDSHGNFWVGTSSGLQRYDRERNVFIDFPLTNPRIRTISSINYMMEDSKGNIWISCSGNGVIRLKSGTFEPTFYMISNSNICSNIISCLFEDKYGNIWLGSADNGISILNESNSTIVNYAHDPNNKKSLSNNNVNSICEDNDGSVLIGTIGGGINRFHMQSRSFEQVMQTAGKLIFSLFKDNSGKLWIGTDGDGLFFVDPATKKMEQYESDLISANLLTAKIHGICQDHANNMWFAIYQSGVLMSPSKLNPFQNIGFNPHHPEKSIGNHCVLSVLKDQNDQLWIGTEGGLYKFDKNGKLMRHYLSNTTDNFPGNSVLSIFEDSKGRIWIGFYLHPLCLYHPETDRFTIVSPTNDESLLNITCFVEDKQGNLWMGSMGNGLQMYHPEKNQVTSYRFSYENDNHLVNDFVYTLLMDKNQYMWIGTADGLSRLDFESGVFTSYASKDSIMRNDVIYSLFRDNDGSIWIGTCEGLIHYHPHTGKNIIYDFDDGLPNEIICGIEKDKNGNLWISTHIGLSMFNRETKTFTNYFVYDGLQDNEFRRGAHFVTRDGELFFGGINGVTHFYPFNFQPDHQLYNLLFTDLFIYNQKITPKDEENDILLKNLNYTGKIKLPYSTKNFTIGFIAVEYNYPGKVTYLVKMEGFDPDWITVPMENQSATYTNLNPGSYTFKVRAFIGDDDYKEKILQIIITPPFWLTWPVKIIYLLLILLIVFSTYITIIRRINKKKEGVKRQHEEQIMEFKLQSFADISHEIRTPLTLILTPLEVLIKDTPQGKLRNTFLTMYQNGERILRLINQVIDIRKLDRGKMKLKAEETDVSSFLSHIMESFLEMAQKKQIDFTCRIEDNMPLVWIDQDKIDKVMFNLLSNAFKFTPNEGSIQIHVSQFDEQLIISVADTGIGIPDDFKELIFNRFYQVQDKNNTYKMGTGIGLDLSRSLIELHRGKIYVENNHPSGTVFTILLPLGKEYLHESEMVIDMDKKNPTQPSLIVGQKEITKLQDKEKQVKKKQYKILVVEDDVDILALLDEHLSEEYQVLTVDNGKDGLETALKEIPDCIITDLMMPEMDGISFIKKVKMNEKTGYIPVIILTAKININHQIQGLQTGADAYITKPFNIDLLKTHIEKLIEQRKVIKQKYDIHPTDDEANAAIPTTDEALLQKFETLIKTHISNPDFSVELIAKELGLSRSQLQRRIKSHTRQNPSDYIKIYRLKYAAKLLETKRIPIAEAAYASGFSSLAHFSNCFREHYGMTPTAYSNIMEKNKLSS